MPSLNDIVAMAQAMEKSPVVVVEDRCLCVRNRNASCRRCMGVCQVGAIAIAANEITLDASACMACGACTSVCPTEALVSVAPLDADLSRAAAQAAVANGGAAVFSCARMAAKHQADPARFAEVPCLARIDESIIVGLVAHGADQVLLVDGDCASCKYRSVQPCIEATVAYANELLAVHGSSVRAVRTSAFPDSVLVEDAGDLYGSTRRGFLSEAAGAARETAVAAARTTIEQELGYSAEKLQIGERLRVSASGEMPRLHMPRHEVTINALDDIGLPCEENVETRLFGTVDIDTDRCNACSMCAVFCPTGALARDPVEKMSEPLRYLEFSASDCVQCGMCVDVCWKGAVSLSATVPTAELFDFEPRAFAMNTPPPRRSAFG
ncbi:MAG TPA: 4Fe-4S ferredoxin [Eggerthellaceae bacterium]|nr:4Fe-4S ferredoxin [Eggerthellaceae bacterium]